MTSCHGSDRIGPDTGCVPGNDNRKNCNEECADIKEEKLSEFRHVFPNAHVVLPVIHVSSKEQAMRNATVAHDAGADGVFLINHVVSVPTLLHIHAEVTTVFPDWWIGLNCLGLDPVVVFDYITASVGGIWVDNAWIDEEQEEQESAETIQAARHASGWQGLYFGGVAFKYQRRVENVRRAALVARNYMDVVTTSGPGTGKAADADKIRVMKSDLGSFPLAIASGITPDNIAEYLPFSDCYLVATGISKSFEELDAGLVHTLVDIVRDYDSSSHVTLP